MEITLYTRADCHLCDEIKALLATMQTDYPHHLVEVDIESDEMVHKAFMDRIPVVEIGPYRLEAPITEQSLRVSLGAASDRLGQLEKIGVKAKHSRPPALRQITRADRISYWFSKNYLSVFNVLVFLFVGLPFLAPVLMRAGLPGPAQVIYRSYSLVCHQLAFRSWFLFGEQAAYPRAAAGVEGYVPFQEATGLSEDNNNAALFAARDFVGNDQVGYKVANCERDVAIYGAILLFGLIFSLTGRRIPALPWYLWFLIGIAPIGFDGFSQLLSQPPFHLIPYRESTPLLRTITGSLFGFTTAWFGYPIVEETMIETRRLLAVKFSRGNAGEKKPGTSV